MKIWWCFDNLGLNYGGKGGFYGHFFSSFRFETLHRVSGSYYGVCVKIFCDFTHSGPNYGEKGVFSKVGLSEHKYRLSF